MCFGSIPSGAISWVWCCFKLIQQVWHCHYQHLYVRQLPKKIFYLNCIILIQLQSTASRLSHATVYCAWIAVAHYAVTVISKSCIVQEHASAEVKVYHVLMYGLDIHDFNRTWKFSCTENFLNEIGDGGKAYSTVNVSIVYE